MTPSPKPKLSLTNFLRPIHMGALVINGQPQMGLSNRFVLGPDDWKHHMAVLGGTGSGKSKFLERFCQGLMINGQGGILIDPHGDTATNLLAFVAHRYTLGDDLWKRVHYLELGPRAAFSYDPFASAPRRKHLERQDLDIEYYSWLKAKVDRIVRAVLRRVAEADMEVMNRLKRWLKNVLYACGVAVDTENTHLGLDHALLFTDPQHDDFPPYYRAVQKHLPNEVQSDFRKLISTKRAQDQEKWVESTINRLREILSPLMKTVFGQHGPSINIPHIIRNRGFVIANLAETPYVSFDEKVVLGGLLIDEVFVAKIADENVPESERVPFTMIIDESGEFLGEDLQRGLGAVRKYKLSIVLAAQDLSTFAKGELDIAPKVLSMCGTVVCFRQTYRKDKEILVDRVGAGNINFEEHLVERQFQRGHNEFIEKELGESRNRGTQTGTGEQQTTGETESSQSSTSHGSSQGSGHTEGSQAGSSTTTQHGEGHHKSKAESGARSNSDSRSRSSSTTESSSIGRALSRSQSVSRTFSQSESFGESVTYKMVRLPNLVSEWERNGLEAGTIPEQYERMMQQLHGLRTAEAIVSLLRVRAGLAVKIAFVPELWHENEKWIAINGIRQLIRSQHAYNFSPMLIDPEAMSLLERITIANASSAAVLPQQKKGGHGFNEE